MTSFCPCCGYNLVPDEPVEIDGWRIEPRGGVYFDGKRIHLRASWRQILYTVASLGGDMIRTEALLARVSDSENNNVLASHVSQMRSYLREYGIACPVVGMRGCDNGGYRWDA